MKTVIYYYTGTGNSLWTSRLLAAELGNAELHPLFPVQEDTLACADAIGLIFPVHMWGLPSPVLKFLKKIKNNPSRYYFACAVNAGQVSRTLIHEKCTQCRICEKVCPVGNIVMIVDEPTWLHRCEQCPACIQWCPTEAIQYCKKTPKYERYHHPEVTLKDIIGDF